MENNVAIFAGFGKSKRVQNENEMRKKSLFCATI